MSKTFRFIDCGHFVIFSNVPFCTRCTIFWKFSCYHWPLSFCQRYFVTPSKPSIKKIKIILCWSFYQQSLNCKVDEPIPNLHFKHCQNVHKHTFMLLANHIVYTLSFGTESYLLACWLGLDWNVTLPNLLQYPDPVWWIWIMSDFFE